MKRVTLLTGCAIAVVAAASIALWPAQHAQSTTESSSPVPAVPVEVQTLKRELVPIYQNLPGRTVASEVAEIRPQVTGIVTERLFVEGSAVAQGQQLYQIDPAPYEAAYQSALADLQKAKANVASTKAKKARYEELVKIDAVSKQDFDDVSAGHAQAAADVAIAEAKVAAAKIDLGYTKVFAPISGKIGKSLVTKGALVTANQAQNLTTITRLDPIYVDIVQPAIELFKLRKSLSNAGEIPVALYFEGQLQSYPHQGKLQFADVQVDETTGSVQLRALFPNPEGTLLPGMFVRAKFQGSAVDGVLVPQRAGSRDRDGALKVWVLQSDNTVAERVVTTAHAVGDSWLVTEGLQAGEQIVVKGIQKLQNGTLVEPSTEEPREAGSTGQQHG